VFWAINVHHFKERGWGLNALFFVVFVNPIFFAKQNMLSNQVEGKIIK
jgi:hypothetical protein